MVLVYTAASFLGAAPLFLVEPMLAKMLLPSFGGSPMVWNTCTLFFQMLLLAAFVRPHLRAAAGSPAAAGRTWTRLLDLDGWHVVSPAEAQAWTDDYSSVVTALRSPR